MTADHAVPHCWDDVLGEDERRAAEGYTGARRVRSRRALLLIDLYNRAFGDRPAPLAEAVRSEPSSCGLAGWQALPALERLLAAARAAGTPVVHTVGAPFGSGVGRAAQRTAPDGPEADHLRREQWRNAIIDPLAPRQGELTVAKARASAFFGTPLDAYLRTLGVESLIVAGESTSGCVRASVVDAYSLGFDVVVAEEGTFDRSPLSHQVNLFDMHCKYATVAHEAVATDLLRHADEAVLNA